jgi:hypothetical protein
MILVWQEVYMMARYASEKLETGELTLEQVREKIEILYLNRAILSSQYRYLMDKFTP